MAVTVLFGTAGSGKTAACFSEIKEWIQQGGRAVLLVPDQATFGVERRFAEFLPGKGFAGMQVLGFSRLAFRVFQERGKEHVSISDLARQIILQRLLRDHEDELTALRTAARQPNFAQTMGQFIWECRSFCITPEQLRQAAEGLEGLALANKLKDTSILYEGYSRFLEERFGNADDMMTLLAQEVGNYSFLQGAHIWIDGFQWFTPQQLAVLRKMGTTAADMTITLTADPQRLQMQQRETALFHRSYEVYLQLRQLFPGLQTRAVHPATGFGRLSQLLQDYFHPVPKAQNQADAALDIIQCASRDVEIDATARRILLLCRKGYRFSDMVVLVRTSDLYNHIAERIFRMYHIPCFTDYRRPMVEHPAAEMISALLEVLYDRWAYEPLFRLLKTDLFPLERQDIDALENYCLAYGIQGRHWLQEEDWTYWKHSFIDEQQSLSPAEEEALRRINDIRRAVTCYIQPLFEQAARPQTVRTWCTILYDWLVKAGVPETLRQWKMDADEAGQTLEGKEHEQVWKQIIVLLDELVRLCGDEEMELEDFAHMVEDGLKDLKFSLIPPTLDHVTVTSVERGYTMHGKIVFICGLNDGIFPQHCSDEGLLSDVERQRLDALGITLGPGSRFRSFQEKFLFYLACTRASDQLILTYSLTDESGGSIEPSSWIGQMLEKGYVDQVQKEKGAVNTGQESSYLVSMPAALQYLPLMLRPALEERPVSDVWWALYDWALSHGWQDRTVAAVQGLFHWNVAKPLPRSLVRALYAPTGVLRGSVTKFESYRRCPFAYFAQYGLGAEERQQYTFAAPDLGMLVHGALRIIGEQLLQEGRQWKDIAADAVEPLCRAATEQLAPYVRHDILMSNAYFSHIKERLIRTLIRTVRRICRFSSVSHFKTTSLEQSFGRQDSTWEPLQFTLDDGLQVVITGQIDRVDVLSNGNVTYVAVIDYKSGKVKLDLRQVYSGLELQLLTYMYIALLNLGSDAVPAAILYCYVRDDTAKESRPISEDEKEAAYLKQSKMNGYYLKNGAVLQELDTSLQGYSDYMNIFLKKDGTFRSDSTSIFDEQDWQLLLEMAGQRLYSTASELASGSIAIHPAWIQGNASCRYCPYGGICQFDRQLPENGYAVMNAMATQELIQKIREEGGYQDGVDTRTTSGN